MPKYCYVMEIEDPEEMPDGAVLAFIEPKFIIKDGGTYWVSAAVVGYNLDHASNATEQTGVANVIEDFVGGVLHGRVRIAVLDESAPILPPSDQSTDPRQPQV